MLVRKTTAEQDRVVLDRSRPGGPGQATGLGVRLRDAHDRHGDEREGHRAEKDRAPETEQRGQDGEALDIVQDHMRILTLIE